MLFILGELVKKPSSEDPDLVGVVADITTCKNENKVGIRWPGLPDLIYENTLSLVSLDK